MSSFLLFVASTSTKEDAEASLAAVNAAYGCPLIAENGYRMGTWDVLIQSNDGTEWGFYRPKPMLGKTMGQLMRDLRGGYSVRNTKPSQFFPPEEEE